MPFLVKVHRPSFMLFLSCFRAKQCGIEQVLDNLTFNHMDALRRQIQSPVAYVLNHCFRTYAMSKQILTMISRINLL